MKKFLILTLAVLMSFCCVACNTVIVISHGTVEDNVYTSDFTGITFTAPDGWTYLTDAEIAELVNTNADALFNESFADAIAEMESFTEMMATDPKTGTNVNIVYENLATSGNTGISEEDYLNASMEQLQSALTGVTVKLVGSEDVTLCGANYLRAQLSTTASGISMTQYQYIRKISNYMVIVTATITTGYEVADIEAMFS